MPANHTTSVLQAHDVSTCCRRSLLYMGTKPVVCSCSSPDSFRTVHSVLCFSTAVLSIISPSRICHSFSCCQFLSPPADVPLVCSCPTVWASSFYSVLWCCLACMVFYVPLSHLLSSGLMVAITNSTAVPVTGSPGGANFNIFIAKHCSWPYHWHIFLISVALLLVRFTS